MLTFFYLMPVGRVLR